MTRIVSESREIMGRSLWRALGLVVLALAVLGPSRESRARLQPYYILKSASAGNVKPRILFVLDTSGSMALRARSGTNTCAWSECESTAYAGTDRESRISAARRAIRETVTASSETANFSLMTFDQYGPHVSNPPKCTNGDTATRFTWVTESAFSVWSFINRYSAHTGAWRLCQGSAVRPYPYLRWDNLGSGSVVTSNGRSGAVPDSPLISVANLPNNSNATRKVQWFSKFVGVRFQANATTDPSRAITSASYGDYGNTEAERTSGVYNQDFYYWPYVDGFPGYSQLLVWPYSTGADYAGIAGSNDGVATGQLYAPFYLDLSATAIASDNRGPGSAVTANAEVLALSAPIIEGGLDADGGTPWASAVGTIPSTATENNAQYSHTTAASYLKFVTTANVPDVCAPTAAILLTDGQPSSGQGGATLYKRVADLRKNLAVPVYVIGFFLQGNTELNKMACAGAGACDGSECSNPCSSTPSNDWDTCFNPASPTTSCAYEANSAQELQSAIANIVSKIGDFDVHAGPGAELNEYEVQTESSEDGSSSLQTELLAYTEHPSWRGHVVRRLCSDRDADGNLRAYCVSPTPEFPTQDAPPTFGPCPLSRSWDAGECLRQTAWTDRRLYTHGSDNQIFKIAESDGTATAAFVAELTALNLIAGSDSQAEADAIAAFVLGRDAPDAWKLPGLANSSPNIVRRIPKYRPDRLPEVAIRDPHCGGRAYPEIKAGALPDELYTFAKDAWDADLKISSPSPHYEYQEAVVVADDFGVVHAFGLDNGNEMWGLVPRFALAGLVEKAAIGAATYGQPPEIENHNYGLAATLNQGWVFDDRSPDATEHSWRHLGVIGMGIGGREYIALDLSHASPMSSRGPVEVLWTSEDDSLKKLYDRAMGETWARPALTYIVPGDDATATPQAHLIMGSGYDPTASNSILGKVIVDVDALSGEIKEFAVLPNPVGETYDKNYAAALDPVVGTHCLSRFWAEMQEVYVADPAGRVFRWDLGRDQDHAADSGGRWKTTANSAFREPLYACVGSGSTCAVSPKHPAEPFAFAPSVSALDRIDDFQASSNDAVQANDQFLVALISGSTNDDALPASFHSSLYLLVDNHAGSNESGGFTVPSGNPKVEPGTQSEYMRLALSDISRTRTYVPFSGATPIVDTRTFSRRTRPVRPPRIFVTGVVDAAETAESGAPRIIDGVEVYYVEFTVYEPPTLLCDPTFYDSAKQEWHTDPGSTFKITFRLTADTKNGFDFKAGADPEFAEFGKGFTPSLTLQSVSQNGTGNCADGGCGPDPGVGGTHAPCDNTGEQALAGGGVQGGVPLRNAQLRGFTPFE